MKRGIAFLIFWTPFFASIEFMFFHMTLQQVIIARTIAGIFNFAIGCHYLKIKKALGGAWGMFAIKLAVTGLAYSTVIAVGLAEFHLGKLVVKTLIATTAGFIAGKLGLFDAFYNQFFQKEASTETAGSKTYYMQNSRISGKPAGHIQRAFSYRETRFVYSNFDKIPLEKHFLMRR